MVKNLLNDEQDKFLREIALGRSNQECADLINSKFRTSFSKKQINTYKSKHKIVSGKKPWEFINQREKLLTTEQDRYLRENVHMRSSKELAEMLNKKFGIHLSENQIRGYKSRYGITSGFDGKFKKGMAPANKGKKMPKEVYEKAKATMFKPGDKPHNTQPVGTTLKRSDGYWWCKYHDNKIPSRKNWELVHRHMWEEANGPIPEDCVLIFKDGNTDHIELDNLMLVTKQERLIMARNHLFNESADLTETGAILAKVIQKTTERSKEK